MRALLLRKGKKEVDRREGRRGKGRGRDLPDQCQSASYAHEFKLKRSKNRVRVKVVRLGRWRHSTGQKIFLVFFKCQRA